MNKVRHMTTPIIHVTMMIHGPRFSQLIVMPFEAIVSLAKGICFENENREWRPPDRGRNDANFEGSMM